MKNKKLLILNICIVLAFAFSIIYVFAVGSVYPLHTRTFLPHLREPPETEVVMEPEGVVSVEGVRLLDRGEVVVDFRALKQGQTHVRMYLITIIQVSAHMKKL